MPAYTTNDSRSRRQDAEDIDRQVTPMPEPHQPYQETYHEPQRYDAQSRYDERYDYSHPSHSGDVALDPEEHHRAYYNEPYQSAPQDIPLLGMPSAQDHGHLYDPDPFQDPRRDSFADPFRDQHRASISDHPGLQHRYSSQSLEQPPRLHHEDSSYDLGAGTPGTENPPTTDAPGGLKRAKTVKPVQLFHGNLVLDCPVPPKILNTISEKEREYTHMRYTAATCDPSEFYEKHFTLRQQLYGKPRRTELFIVVTMYNEDDLLFARTMAGVWQNIQFMCNGKKNGGGSWGPDGWKKIVVCVVSDGRAKINARTKGVLTAMGCYQEGIAKQKVNDEKVTAHIYENTTKVGIEVKNELVVTVPGAAVPVQMLFCLKEENQKKINSHRWAIQAFGSVLKPNICVLLDAGTRPGKDSIYYLWRAFDLNPHCGGACGEIKAMLGKGGKYLRNPLIATQNFEYKMSNILDKPMESAFGFISVLPGAFSAYRYVALQNDKSGEGPLEKYFAGEKMHADAGIFAANMYLAEDRILCFELVAKRQSSWVLTYVKNATGETDVPDNMTELILQRRRWLNGSFFAAVYALAHFYDIFRSSHSMTRKIFFLIEFLYQTISMIFAWFAIGNFFLVFQILTTSLGEPLLLGKVGVVFGIVMQWLYVGTLVTCFVLSLGNRPQGSNKFYMTMVYFWTAIMIYLTFASVFITVKSVQEQLSDGKFTISELFTNSIFFTLIVSLLSTYILWIFVSLLFADAWHIVTSTVQYILLTPTYCNVINVYAFCNTHDITWGTKGDDKPPVLASAKTDKDGKLDVEVSIAPDDLNALYTEGLKLFEHKAPEEVKEPSKNDVQQDYYKGFRSAVVLAWMFCNAVLIAVVLKSGGLSRLSVRKAEDEERRKTQVIEIYLKVVLWSVAGLSAFKFVGAMYFLANHIAQKGWKHRNL